MPERADPEAATISSENLEAAAPGAVRSVTEESPPLLAGRYELLGMLGRGAMGVVYRARDRELDEIVALKFLMKELASPAMLERFRREVKLARRVTHRNVARTFDIGEHAGDRFLTMELVEGELLSSLLERRRRLPIADALRLTTDVCAGLAAAHAADVLHRDLKPENVIVAKDGRAVIADFGIARAVSESAALRTSGGLVGTPAYMAPEQVEGRADLDARADLYALGTMLYELLTGELAWKGDSVVTIATGRLLRPPPDPRELLPTLDGSVAALILKLMARSRDDRYQTADEVRAAIAALDVRTSSSSASALPSASPSASPALASGAARSPFAIPTHAPSGARVVAVLPVLNLASKDDAYLVDNIDEDVVDLLSVVPNVLVRPRGETARFTESSRDVREIGRSLGADVVVDASLRRVGEAVRIAFRLITVQDGFQLWARRFERPPAEVLSIADEAARAIASALTAELTTHVRARAADPQAEELFLRGRYLLRRGWHDAVREAVETLKQAHMRSPEDVRIMGTYALALARAYGLADFGRETAIQAQSLATTAAARDPVAPEAKVALGMLHLQEQEAEEAVSYLRSALGVSPNSVDALDWLARLLCEIGRIDDSIALFTKVQAVDPTALHARFQIARLKAIMGDIGGLEATLGDMPEHASDIGSWFAVQARAILWRRDAAGAERLAERLKATENIAPSARFAVASCLRMIAGASIGPSDVALIESALPVDRSIPKRRASFNAQMRAELLMSGGMAEPAAKAVRDACDHGLFDVVWLDRCPLLDQLRPSPEFVEIRAQAQSRADRIAAVFDRRASVVY